MVMTMLVAMMMAMVIVMATMMMLVLMVAVVMSKTTMIVGELLCARGLRPRLGPGALRMQREAGRVARLHIGSIVATIPVRACLQRLRGRIGGRPLHPSRLADVPWERSGGAALWASIGGR